MQLTTLTNKPTMSSREIAELTEKDIAHVHRDIRAMLDQLKDDPELEHVTEDMDSRRYTTCFHLTKNLSYTLVAGYNVKLRKAIIDRWQELEAQQAPKLPTTYIQALEKLLEVEKAKEEMALRLEAQKPFADFGTAVSASATQVLIGEWIKAINDDGLKIGRNKAFAWLRENGYLARDNMPMQKYVEQGLFKVKEALVNIPGGQRATFTTMLTGKGQVYFAGKLKDFVERNPEPLQLLKK